MFLSPLSQRSYFPSSHSQRSSTALFSFRYFLYSILLSYSTDRLPAYLFSIWSPSVPSIPLVSAHTASSRHQTALARRGGIKAWPRWGRGSPPALPGYELMESSARGGMGEVLARAPAVARPHGSRERCAQRLAKDPEFVERFAKSDPRSHRFAPANIRRSSIGGVGRAHFLVMEIVVGKSLREVRSQGARFVEATQEARCRSQAIDHAHAQGVHSPRLEAREHSSRRSGHVKVVDVRSRRHEGVKPTGSSRRPRSPDVAP